MAKKPTLGSIASGYASGVTLDNNFTLLRDAFDNTLSLDGSTPNAMGADLDMDSNDILNVEVLEAGRIVLAGVPVGEVGNSKATRPELVAWWSEALMPAGGIVFDGRVAYKAVPGSTAIPDLPGLVPFPTISPDHWVYNATPGTTDMAAATQSAINYAGVTAGADLGADRTAAARVDFLPQRYYFSTGVSWDSTYERVWLEGNGATIETDIAGVLISIGDSVMFTPGADTASSTETYNNKIKGFVFRHTGATETNPIAIRMGRAWNTVIEENHFWDFGTFIDCFNCGQLWMQQNKFFVRARTADSEAILRLRGAYNSTNSYQTGAGISLIQNEVSGKPSDLDLLKRVWWVQSVDGLYYANNHCQHYEKGLVIDPTGSDDNYQNNVVIEVLSGGANYWDDPAPGGRNVSIEGKIAYAGTSGQQNGNVKNVKFAPGDYLRGAGNATYGVYMDLVDGGGFVAGRGGVTGLDFQGTYEQHRGSAIWLSRDGATKVPAVKPRISAAFAAGRRGGSTGGTSYILLNTKGAHISDCTFAAEDFAPDRAISISCSDYTDSEITIVGNDVRDTTSTSDCIQINLGATDLLTAAANSVPDGDGSSAGGNVLHNGLIVDGRQVNGYVFADRAEAIAAENIRSTQEEIYVRTPSGHILSYIKDATGTALTMDDGKKWSPAGTKFPDHWGENTTPGTTDMTTAINTAIAFGDNLGCDLLDSSYLISGPILITGNDPDVNTTEPFRFVGRGPGLSRIVNSTPETDWLTVSKGGALRTGWITGIIRDVSFVSDLSNRPTTVDEGAAIRLKRALKVKIRDVEIDASNYPIYQENAGMSEVSNLYVRKNLVAEGNDAGSLFTFAGGPGGRCFGQFWSDIEAQAGRSYDKGFDIVGLDGLYVTNSHINNVSDRVHIRPNGAGGEDRCYQLHFTNCYFDGNGISDVGDGFVFAPDMPPLDIDIPAGDVNASTDVMVSVGHGILNGAVVQFSSTGTLPGGISAATNYWVLSLGANSFRLATSYDNWLTNTYVDITSAGTGTHTLVHTPDDIIRIMGIQKTGGIIRRGTNVFKFSGLLRGLESLDDVIINGVEFQDFTGVWVSLNSASLSDPLTQVQNIKIASCIFEDGPTNAENNSNLFVIAGKNISITGNIIQGNWTNAGQFVYNIQEESDNVLVYGNVHDVPRTNDLATINADAGRVIGLTRSNANGSYILRPDGTMQCRHTLELPFQSASVCWADWTYPAAFKEAPTVSGSPADFTGTVAETALAAMRLSNKSTTSVRVRQPRVLGTVDFTSGEAVDAELIAEGRYE